MNHCTQHDHRVEAFEARLANAAELLFAHVQHCRLERVGLPCPVCQAFELLGDAITTTPNERTRP